jgi:feruloyl esterase
MQTAQAAAPPFTVSATRPLCRYPAYPHYQGGPASEAASFACQGAD